MRKWLISPFGVCHEAVAIVSIRSKSFGGGYCAPSDKVMRRWLLFPFGVSHEAVAIVSNRSKS